MGLAGYLFTVQQAIGIRVRNRGLNLSSSAQVNTKGKDITDVAFLGPAIKAVTMYAAREQLQV
jgi:hypothetical protein